jgi:hypothetical protein
MTWFQGYLRMFEQDWTNWDESRAKSDQVSLEVKNRWTVSMVAVWRPASVSLRNHWKQWLQKKTNLKAELPSQRWYVVRSAKAMSSSSLGSMFFAYFRLESENLTWCTLPNLTQHFRNWGCVFVCTRLPWIGRISSPKYNDKISESKLCKHPLSSFNMIISEHCFFDSAA